MEQLLSISIGLNPNVAKIAGLQITWHGVFTAVGIVAGVWLAVKLAGLTRANIDEDTAYTIGMIVVAAGIIGARALYVAERYGESPNLDSVGDIFKITEGGISIYGAIIGGAVAGWAYGLWKRLRCAAAADAAVFGMMLGLAIGRIGDIINGEHFAKASSLPWAVLYTNPKNTTGAFERSVAVGPTHPAVAYEMIGDLVIIGILTLMWRLRPKSGVLFVSAFLLYAIMRLAVSFLRVDSKTILLGLSTPEVISIGVIIVSIPLLLFFLRRREPEFTPASSDRGRFTATRAERRRRLRAGS